MNFLDEFQSMVRRYPDKTAIVDRGGRRTTTYRELDALSRRIAAKLAQSGEISGQAVLVCMDRRMEYAAAEIGVLMAGAAFAPVLPEYPKERLDYIQEDCQAAVRIDADWLRDVGRYEEASPVRVADENRAMLIYTSGSTGRPKGIVHSMASLTQGIMRVRSILYLEDKDVVAAMAPMSFVVLVMEYFGTLSCGACTHIVPEEIRKDVRMIEDYFVEYDITCAFFSPQIMKFFKNKGGALKKVATGSERVSRLSGDGFELYNVYGCSETAMIASYYKIDEPMENTPIGKPAQGLKFFVLDENGNEVADEEDGELCIKGILGEAYLNLEEQSARTFQKQEDGEVLIHTGDIVRRLKDGNYLYVNRKDWMVKINGQRVETGEIEIKMSSMEGVENAVVKAFSDENGQNYLCGYYVAKPEIMSEQLRAFLRDALPDYMIPRFFKRLDALPKNVNGKLDRTVLLPPGPEEYKAKYQEPKNDVERRICSGFEEVLHCGKTGREDDFFRLGGDSINVLQLLECLSELPMTPEMVLRGRTPEMIAELLNADEAEKIEKACGKRDVYPLTDSQMGVYLECVNDPEATMYNIPMCCELPKKIDLNRFKEAVGLAVARHTSFGVNIALDNGAPVMCLHPEFQRADLKEWEVEDIEAVKKTFVRPFCMEGEPLYRMALYRCKGRCYFLFDVHHLIFDGTSVKVFLDEVSLLYQGEEPKPEEISLTDLAVYEETLKETPRYQSAREYFKGRFAGVDIEEMLIKDFRKKVITPRSKAVRQACGEEVSCMAVEQFVRQKGISENTLFLGAFSYVLAKLSGLNKSFFCTVNNGRHTTKLAQSTGMFVRTLPVSHSFEERMAVDEYLKGFQEDFYELMSHDCISFAELARDYGIASDILFVYQGEMLNGLTFAGEKYPAKPIPAGDVQANISVMVMKNQEGYEISLEYRTDLYREETARGLLRMMQQTLQGMLSCLTLKEIALPTV